MYDTTEQKATALCLLILKIMSYSKNPAEPIAHKQFSPQLPIFRSFSKSIFKWLSKIGVAGKLFSPQLSCAKLFLSFTLV